MQNNLLQSSADYIRSLFATTEQLKKTTESEHRTDSKGRICPVSIIDTVDLARDDLVNDLVVLWKEQQNALRTVKTTGFSRIEEFLAFAIENYDVKMGGKKNNVSLTSFDQTKKVTISYADRITFTEKLQEAKLHIDKLIAEKSEGVDDVTKALLTNAFTLTDGGVNVSEILRLRRINIKHPEWEAAKQAISDAILPVGAKGYIRLYERDNFDSPWEAISLDIAAL
jgi:hypothetical protein